MKLRNCEEPQNEELFNLLPKYYNDQIKEEKFLYFLTGIKTPCAGEISAMAALR
jgi:hypothetical protein